MPKIFISYRRDDNKAFVERIHDRLVVAFGKENVFQDVDDGILAGTKWKNILKTKLDESDVLLVVIGDKWEHIINERAPLPNDWVRYEVEQGLGRGDNIVLIPTLIENTDFPTKLPESIKTLSDYQVYRVRGNPDFNRDMDKLAALINKHFLPQKAPLTLATILLSFVGLLISIAAIIGSVYFVLQAINGNYGWASANNPTPTEEITESTTEEVFITEAAINTDSPVEESIETRTETPTNIATPSSEPTATDTDSPTNTPTNEHIATEMPSPEPTLADSDAAIERARNFTGERNSNWTPYTYTFEDGIEMALVPVGCFVMGSTAAQIQYAISLGTSESAVQDEQPAETYCIDEPFWIDVTEVTQAQFQANSVPRDYENAFTGDNLPVESIKWFEARNYCESLGKRLPSEAEWEYAARGVESLNFPWGNEFVEENVVYRENSDAYPMDVGSHPEAASWVGAMDMSGNVWEWTNTIYGIDTDFNYNFIDRGERLFLYPYNPDDGRELNSDARTDIRIVRGGSWFETNANFLRSALRYWLNPDDGYPYAGFRCVRDIDS